MREVGHLGGKLLRLLTGDLSLVVEFPHKIRVGSQVRFAHNGSDIFSNPKYSLLYGKIYVSPSVLTPSYL